MRASRSFMRHWKPLIASIVALVTGPVYVLYVLAARVDRRRAQLDFRDVSDVRTNARTRARRCRRLRPVTCCCLIDDPARVRRRASRPSATRGWGPTPDLAVVALRPAPRPRSALLAVSRAVVVLLGFVACLLPAIWLSVTWSLCHPRAAVRAHRAVQGARPLVRADQAPLVGVVAARARRRPAGVDHRRRSCSSACRHRRRSSRRENAIAIAIAQIIGSTLSARDPTRTWPRS